MKKLLVISLLILSSSSFFLCIAQFNIYHPFPHSNAWWSEKFRNNVNQTNYYDYHVLGDTIVNGKTYFKLNKSGGYDTRYGSQSYDSLTCLLREDTSAKRIYASFKPNFGIRDTLLYDFNLKVGDTIPPTYNCRGAYVKSIDSILIGTRYRKQFFITTVPDTTWNGSLIEGIGSTGGLLEPITEKIGEESWDLLCFKQNDTTDYPALNDNCQTFVLGVPTINEQIEPVEVFPNPSNGRFTIRWLVFSGQSIVEVYNVLDERVYNATISRQTLTRALSEVNLSKQPNGIYFFRIVTGNGSLISDGKLIIQK